MHTFHSSDKEPRLTVVGAGPGDPELITLKGINTLKTADIVLYDALVAEELLKLIPPGVPVLCVGKRAGSHSYTQEHINDLIVEFAFLYGHVVRLKGGDPFVFGRGAEEIEFAAKHGLATAVIPGVSSAVAVPASVNIPVTARGISESFWVVTGTTMAGVISEDVALAAKSTATVVILMGVNKLEEIMTIFNSHGKSQVPVAVVQNGTTKDQRTVVGTVSDIVQLAKQENIASPAVIIVGEVVKYSSFAETLSFRAQHHVSNYQ